MRQPLLIVGVIAAFAGAIGGSYYILESHVASSLEEKAAEALAEGDYVSSIRHYTELEETAPGKAEEVGAPQKVSEAKNFLVAEEILAKARAAAENGDWLAVKALLQRGDVTTNTSFAHYKEAIELYVEAAKKVGALEEKIETELTKFREEAQTEKLKREQAEEEATKTAEELETTIAEKRKREEELQQEIRHTEAQKAEAEKQAAEERLQKFLNELELYVSMLERGAGRLEEAMLEIKEEKDSTALVLLSQGKELFNEVNLRAEELLENRTEDEYKPKVRKLLQTASILISASRSFGSTVFYIDQSDGEEFEQFMTDGRHSRAAALKLLNDLRTFVNSSLR